MHVAHAVPAVAAAALLAIAAPAAAIDYPPPGDPGPVVQNPRGKHRTLFVCKRSTKRRRCFRSIQTAVDRARAGDTVKVADGTYNEGVILKGPAKAGLALIGNRKHPRRVLLEGAGLKASDPHSQNGVQINGASGVTVNGFMAQNFRANGFFAVNVTGYLLTNLVAKRTGAYGIYAFNSIGGTMSRSEAYYNNDAGFYIGQTPKQTRPRRSLVTRVAAWGNVIGFSGTNVKYTTITKSRWFNNGVGIVPNALKTEKFAPPEENVIVDNDIFWNNFNYFPPQPVPFQFKGAATGDVDYPTGVGVLLFGGQRNTIERNRIFGNYAVGVGALEQVLLKFDLATDPRLATRTGATADAFELQANVVRDNAFGAAGADLNGRDLFYDGTGRGNCFAGNTLTAGLNLPADNSTFAACTTPPAANAPNPAAQATALSWATADPTHEVAWVRHPHKPIAGLTPLEHCVLDAGGGCQGQPQ